MFRKRACGGQQELHPGQAEGHAWASCPPSPVASPLKSWELPGAWGRGKLPVCYGLSGWKVIPNTTKQGKGTRPGGLCPWAHVNPIL